MNRKKDPQQPRNQAVSGGARWVTVSEDQAGQRVDNFVRAQLKGVPRSRVYQMLRKGEVRVNRRRCRPADRLAAGDQVRLPPAATRASSRPASLPDKLKKQLEDAVLFEDSALVVLDKPSGLAVHSGSGTPYGLVEALQTLRPEVEWGLAHRLDRGTSGCLVVGKGAKATRALQALFRAEQVEKAYLALVVGDWPGGEHLEESALRRGPERGGQRPMVVDPVEGQAATTRFIGLRPFDGYALVRAEPKTGRTHQIRAHARHWGHPVAGDDLYGDREANAELKKRGLRRVFLHSAEVAFGHPESGERISVRAPLPRELKAVLDRLPT
jgi:23S rRNA pseudouridine955/2504/2580 synthase